MSFTAIRLAILALRIKLKKLYVTGRQVTGFGHPGHRGKRNAYCIGVRKHIHYMYRQ